MYEMYIPNMTVQKVRI